MSILRIIKNSSYLIINSLLSVVISVFVNGYIARKLGTADYGKFIFSLSFVGMFAVFNDMGFHGWGVKQIASDTRRTSEYLGDIITARTFFSVLTFFSICLAISLTDYPVVTKQAVYIAAANICLITTQFASIWIIFEAREAMKYEGISNISGRLLVAGLCIYLMHSDYGIIALSWAYLAGSVLQWGYCYVVLVRRFQLPKFHFSLKKHLSQLRASLPFTFLSFFFVVYYEIDKNMLAWMVDDSSVGLYNAAVTVAYRAAIVSSAVSVACMPAMIQSFKAGAERLARFVHETLPLLAIIGIPIAISVTVLSKDIIDLIYRSEIYYPSIRTLQIIAWMIPLEFFSHFLRFALIASNREKIPAYIIGGGTMFNVVVNLFFIPTFTFNGAALATVLTECILVISMAFYLNTRVFRVRFPLKVALTILANIPLYFFMEYLVCKGASFWAVPLAVPAYLLFLIVFRVLTREYFLQIKNVLLKKAPDSSTGL